MRHSDSIAQLENRIARLEREAKSSYTVEVSYNLKGVVRNKSQAFRVADEVDQRVLSDLGVSNPKIVKESVNGYVFKNTYRTTQFPNVSKESSYLVYRYPRGEVDVHVKVS